MGTRNRSKHNTNMLTKSCIPLAWALVQCVSAYSGGPPTSACNSMKPGHIGSQQPDDTFNDNFSVQFSAGSITVGEQLAITVSGVGDQTFKGILIQARRVSDDTISGMFQAIPDGYKTLKCDYDDSSLIHNSKAEKSTDTYSWTAPTEPGTYTIYMTIVEKYNTFWAKHAAGTIEVMTTTTTLPTTTALVCPVGSYLAASVACVTCPAGSFCPQNAEEATACPAGTFNDITGASSLLDCMTCPKSTYCPAGSVATTLCPAGTWSEQLGLGDVTGCIDCPVGSYCVEGASSPHPCPIGSFSDAPGAHVCLECPIGTDAPVEGSSSCEAVAQICQAGTYLNSVSSTCDFCPAGHFCPEGSVHPTSCPAGTFTNNIGAETVTDCMVCPVGSYCSEGTSEPAMCPAGSYNDAIGAVDVSQCTSCSAGSFCPAGSSVPTVCPAGTFSPELASACSSCPAGYYCPARTADPTPCPTGMYSDTTGSASASDCKVCPDGTESSQGSSECTAIVVCPPGEFLNGTSTCKTCPAGYFCASDNDEATLCPAGAFCPAGSSEPQTCTPGTYNSLVGIISSTDCIICPIGHCCCPAFGQAEPMACTQGTYQDEQGAIMCNPCPAGTYQDETGAVECITCPEMHACVEGAKEPVLCESGMMADEGAAECVQVPQVRERRFPAWYSFFGAFMRWFGLR